MAFFTNPERRHLVQTQILLTPFFVVTRIFCRLGITSLFVLLFAWLTLLPITLCFPQTAQLAISLPSFLSAGKSPCLLSGIQQRDTLEHLCLCVGPRSGFNHCIKKLYYDNI
jgi:hypothetical protein